MKKIIIILFCLFPILINASECNTKKHALYEEYASHINYEYYFDKETHKFSYTFYNVITGLKFKYSKKTYTGSKEDNIVVIDNISEGTDLKILVYGNDKCTAQVRTIYIKAPFFNPMFGSNICENYTNKLTLCSQEFTESKVTEALVKAAIKNYEERIVYESDGKQEEEQEIDKATKMENILNKVTEYGIKLFLTLLSGSITALIYSAKFRKIKHGL